MMPPLVCPTFASRDEHTLSVVGLQSDSRVERRVHPEGTLLQLRDPAHSIALCERTLAIARDEQPDLIVLPELSVPVANVAQVTQAVRDLTFDTVLLAGIEGMHPATYQVMKHQIGEDLDIDPAVGTYVNALLTAVRANGATVVSLRAKRHAAAAENALVNPCLGTSPYRTIALGPQPIRLLPLICAEFSSTLWHTIRQDIGDSPIDLVTVIQMNNDPEQAYPSVALTDAFALGVPFGSARFLLANNASFPEASDGSTYLIYPPTNLRVPRFEHTRTELWHVPRANGYRGFRLPDQLGCVWKMSIRLPGAPTDAYQAIPCTGAIVVTWPPNDGPDRGGLALGLMRSSAYSLHIARANAANPSIGPRLNVADAQCVLARLDNALARNCLYWTSLASSLQWDTVETVAQGLVEAAALLGGGNDDARLNGAACNCTVNGNRVAILHAPNEIDALTKRFSLENCVPPNELPQGAVTYGIDVASPATETRVVGERIRADKIVSEDRRLEDGPRRPTESSVDFEMLKFRSCELQHLRNLYGMPPAGAAAQLRGWLPEVFA